MDGRRRAKLITKPEKKSLEVGFLKRLYICTDFFRNNFAKKDYRLKFQPGSAPFAPGYLYLVIKI